MQTITEERDKLIDLCKDCAFEIESIEDNVIHYRHSDSTKYCNCDKLPSDTIIWAEVDLNNPKYAKSKWFSRLMYINDQEIPKECVKFDNN